MVKNRLLIIEDQEDLAQSMAEAFQEDLPDLFEVGIALDGTKGLEKIVQWHPDVVLLDLNLPVIPGQHLLRHIAYHLPECRVCIVSGELCIEDKLRGFQDGADDYITKPFSLAELKARVQALLRRQLSYSAGLLNVHDLVINPGERSVRRNGQTAYLTNREYDLLLYLVRHPNRAITRNELLERVWNGKDVYANTVDAYIERLRVKIDAHHAHSYVQTAYKVGYRFVLPSE